MSDEDQETRRRNTLWAEQMPTGLCGDRGEHLGHTHRSATLGEFWCTANQDDREPYRSERRRDAA